MTESSHPAPLRCQGPGLGLHALDQGEPLSLQVIEYEMGLISRRKVANTHTSLQLFSPFSYAHAHPPIEHRTLMIARYNNQPPCDSSGDTCRWGRPAGAEEDEAAPPRRPRALACSWRRCSLSALSGCTRSLSCCTSSPTTCEGSYAKY